MIPEKVYLTENECLYETHTIMCLKQRVDKAIEYIRTPIAKKFSEERPKKTGWYLVNCGGFSHFVPTYWYDGKWYQSTHTKACRRFECSVATVKYWAEIILPIVEGE